MPAILVLVLRVKYSVANFIYVILHLCLERW